MGAVDLGDVALARQAADAGKIGVGHDEADAGHGAGLVEAAELDVGVRHRRAEHDGAERSRRIVVVGETAGAGDQRLVFLAPDGGTHTVFRGSDVVHGWLGP